MILCSGGLECVGGKVRCRHGILAVVDVFGSDACFVVFVSHSEGAWTFESSHEVQIEKNGTFFVCVQCQHLPDAQGFKEETCCLQPPQSP
jgi:hypothetical protein